MVNYFIGGTIGACITMVGWLLIHLRNHPNKKDIDKDFDRIQGPDGMQSKEVCNERTERIEAAIQGVDAKLDREFKILKNSVCGNQG